MKRSSDWKLERYLLNELDEPFTPCKEDLIRIEELKKENSIFLNKMPFEKLKLKKELNFNKIFKLFLSPKYSLALSFIIILSIGFFFNIPYETRIKSSDINKLTFSILEDNKIKEIDSSYKLKEGDLIQISYFVSNYKYALIFSFDGNNQSTIHFNSVSEAFKNNKIINLDHSYKLDNAPSFEIFYLVLSNNIIEKNIINKIINNELIDSEVLIKRYYFEK